MYSENSSSLYTSNSLSMSSNSPFLPVPTNSLINSAESTPFLPKSPLLRGRRIDENIMMQTMYLPPEYNTFVTKEELNNRLSELNVLKNFGNPPGFNDGYLCDKNMNIKYISNYPFEKDPGNAGYDLYSDEDKVIAPQDTVLIKTDLRLEFPDNLVGRVCPRSGLSLKAKLDVFAGVIDSSYTGIVGVILYNSNKDKEYEIKKGDRIAQIVFQYICNNPTIEKLNNVEQLRVSERADKGFGSSGR